MGLDELREEIRKKDEEIVRLIAERTAIAVKVGEEKKRNGLQIRDAKAKNEEKTIVFCLSGHGLLDLYGYEQYLDGTLPSSDIHS